jgi:epoxyqueuosine reductase
MTIHPQSPEARIRTFAQDLGFVAVGFAPAGEAGHFALFEQWLASGRAAGMDYLHRHRALRQDPRKLLPEVKTVICVAARYPVHAQPGMGFAMHARGADYHAVLRRKLQQLAACLRADTPTLCSRICVDSAPILEREWAVQAGLGWIGRQGQLINAEHGACLLLGELLVSLELSPSCPAAPQCGDCRRCVTACPTGAIGADGRVDARRCVSYLTIEHAGAIPEDLHAALGTSLFGCDRCTAVCPWNPPQDGTIMPELLPRPMPSADDLLGMNDETFHERFSDTCVARTGRARLQRNAAFVLDATHRGSARQD